MKIYGARPLKPGLWKATWKFVETRLPANPSSEHACLISSFACCMWTWHRRFYLSCHHTEQVSRFGFQHLLATSLLILVPAAASYERCISIKSNWITYSRDDGRSFLLHFPTRKMSLELVIMVIMLNSRSPLLTGGLQMMAQNLPISVVFKTCAIIKKGLFPLFFEQCYSNKIKATGKN